MKTCKIYKSNRSKTQQPHKRTTASVDKTETKIKKMI